MSLKGWRVKSAPTGVGRHPAEYCVEDPAKPRDFIKVAAGGGGMAGRYAANATRALAAFCSGAGERGKIAREVIGAVSPELYTAILQMTACLDELRAREPAAVVFITALPDADERDGSAPKGAGSPAPDRRDMLLGFTASGPEA